MMGFKSFNFAVSTIAGIELYRMLKKSQHVNAANSRVKKNYKRTSTSL
jgi:hypothetical protein